MGDKRRQDPGKADTASNAGTHAGRLGDKGRQDLGKAGASANAREDKTSGRRTHQPTQAHMWGDNGRQAETRPREGRRTIQDRHTCVETMGDKGRQDRGKADTASNGHTCGETMKTYEDPLKAEPPSNTGTHVGRQWETGAGKTSGRWTHHQHRHTCGETMGDKGKRDFGQADTPSNRTL